MMRNKGLRFLVHLAGFTLSFLIVMIGVGVEAAPKMWVTEGDTAVSSWSRLGTDEDGYTVWRQEVNSACLFTDHNYTLDIPADPEMMSDISYRMSNFDVDYNNICNGIPNSSEVDIYVF